MQLDYNPRITMYLLNTLYLQMYSNDLSDFYMGRTILFNESGAFRLFDIQGSPLTRKSA